MAKPKITPAERETATRLKALQADMEARAAARDLAREDGERSDAHHHPAEAATDAEERERALRSHLDAQRRGEAAKRAQEALAKGTYGICVDCGTAIPEARLRIRPDAERCVPCQTLSDRHR